MTGDQHIAWCKGVLEHMRDAEGADAAEREAVAFVLANWHEFEPALVGDIAETIRVRQVAGVIWNNLGLKDPVDVGRWIAGAREELTAARQASGR